MHIRQSCLKAPHLCVHTESLAAKRPLLPSGAMPLVLVACACTIARDEQKEQHENDQEHDRPARVSAEYTVHI